MAQLTVDLLSRESLVAARGVIEKRLQELGEEAHTVAASDEPSSDNEPGRADAEDPELAAALARDLWYRIGGNTRKFILAFANADGPVTLRDVAARLGEEYGTVKARKFRFGRTEKLINRTWGGTLLPGRWDEHEGAVRYSMRPDVAEVLRDLAAGET